MDREHEQALVDFCALQRRAFDAQDWMAAPRSLDVPNDTVAAAAWLLASNSRYGHQAELVALAPVLSPRPMLVLLRKGGLDLSRFSNVLEQRWRELEGIAA